MIHEGEQNKYIKEGYVFLVTFLYKFRAYGREHLAGLEAVSQFEKNVAVAKADILSTLYSCQEPE